MTQRLYYTDSMLTDFDATVVSCQPDGDRFRVVLDRTAFYPTSGGQPFDLGRLGDAEVVDVVDEDDGTIAHVVDRPVAAGAVLQGAVEWRRRLDHMQQHTGQHILSAAFDRLFGVRTVSFHMGADYATIDLAREVTPDEVAHAEAAASEVVFEDRPVDVRFATDEEAARLPLRKESSRTGLLRLVDVTGFDLSACGGTHVPRTGVIGLIAITGVERLRGGSRVSFVCGRRALRSHAALRDVAIAAARVLSVGAAELPAAVERLQEDGKALIKTCRDLQLELSGYRASALRDRAEPIHRLPRVVLSEERGDAAALKALATAVVSEPGYVALLAGSGQPTPIVLARSADVVLDAGAWIKAASQSLGGRGGGRPEQAQGGFTAAAADVFAYARETLGHD